MSVADEPETRTAVISRESKPIYKGLEKPEEMTYLEWIMQKDDVPTTEVSASAQGVTLGRKPQPFNIRAVVDFQDVNCHHTRCLMAKVAATVGLGFRRPEEIPRDIPIGENDLAAAPDPTQHADFLDQTETTTAPGPDGKPVTTTKVTNSIKGKKPNPNAKVAKLAPAGGAGGDLSGLGNVTPSDISPPAVNPNIQNPTAALADRQKPSKCDEILDPLCEVSWADVLNDVAEDYWQAGAGALEVVRRGGDKVTGLHHIPIADLHIFIEDEQYNYHYEVESREGTGFSRVFAKWGDKQAMLTRFGGNASSGKSTAPKTPSTQQAGTAGFFGSATISSDPDLVSEVIYFRRPSSKNRWYGYPDWLSATTSVELVKALTQFKYDFFNNRGVPEFMLFAIGKKLDPKDWTKIENALRATIGQGNSHKSIAVNIEAVASDFTIQLEKLAVEGAETDDFVKTKDCLALDIVTAHGVPPLLAGIQIPGKLGANNELPNALMAFHVLVIGPAQRLFRRILSSTLGSKEAGLGLTDEDFAFRTIPEEIDVGTLQTIGRMRQDLRTARAQGRDPADGLKD